MSVEKILDNKAKEIQTAAVKEIERVIYESEMKFEAYVEQLKQAARVMLPINLVEILAKGGTVYVKEYVNTSEEAPLSIVIGGLGIVNWYEQPTIKKGKYRIILIAEKIEEASK